jgi:hypothetical protein
VPNFFAQDKACEIYSNILAHTWQRTAQNSSCLLAAAGAPTLQIVFSPFLECFLTAPKAVSSEKCDCPVLGCQLHSDKCDSRRAQHKTAQHNLQTGWQLMAHLVIRSSNRPSSCSSTGGVFTAHNSQPGWWPPRLCLSQVRCVHHVSFQGEFPPFFHLSSRVRHVVSYVIAFPLQHFPHSDCSPVRRCQLSPDTSNNAV